MAPPSVSPSTIPAPQVDPCDKWIKAYESWKAYAEKLALKIKDLESQLQALQNQKPDTSNLDSQISDLKTQLQDLEAKLTAAESRIKDLESQLAAAESRIEELETENSDLKSEIQSLSDQNSALNDQLKKGRPYYIFLCSVDSDEQCFETAVSLKTVHGFDIRFVKLTGTNVSRDKLPRLYLFPSGKHYDGPNEVLTALNTLDKIPNEPPSQ